MSGRGPLVHLADVGLRYPSRGPVLRDVNLRLDRNDVVVVHGANVSGKTSLLKIVAGILIATTGRVRRRVRTVGYLPDRFPSQLRLPAASYLHHMAALHRAEPRWARRAAPELLDDLGFSGGLDLPMAQLSKGNAQKVALAQALGGGAEVLILDEPFSGLDTDACAAVHRTVASAATTGTTILLTDHTAAATTLPSIRELALVGGALSPAEQDTTPPHGTERPSVPAEVVVVLFAPEPRRVLAGLPAAHALAIGPSELTVGVALAHRDALLTAALAQGCGIRTVTTATDA